MLGHRRKLYFLNFSKSTVFRSPDSWPQMHSHGLDLVRGIIIKILETLNVIHTIGSALKISKISRKIRMVTTRISKAMVRK